MRVACIEIANFRKLKSVRVDIAEKTTLLVGANNSGKTSAMDALRLFLGSNSSFKVTDFTLSDLQQVKEIGGRWEAESKAAVIQKGVKSEASAPSQNSPGWDPILPTLDIWIEAKESELYRVRQLLPILDDYVGAVGVRLRCEPRDVEQLRTAFLARRQAVVETTKDLASESDPIRLWPKDLVDFLDRQMGEAFVVRPYKLDPNEIKPTLSISGASLGSDSSTGDVILQPLSEGEEALDINPIPKLVRVDIVNAQRGLGADDNRGRLSTQVSSYYSKHLDFDQKPEPADLEAIQATQHASDLFDSRLERAFKVPLEEVARMGYPGGKDPRVIIRTNLRLTDGLNHASVLRYQMGDDPSGPNDILLELPEAMNGLGYQNLVLMIFNLMGFRDARLKIGKASISVTTGDDSPEIKPLHLVLIEEPEAHLHAQVQQVFINRAYQTLTESITSAPNAALTTQLIVSTHSSHIAHELDFASIRYFRRSGADEKGGIPVTTVRNLSSVFGSKDDTAKFVQRYLKVQHCNIFFADALVLLEGAAERILLPYFIEEHHRKLHESYVEYLDIGGAHAHRLRGLVDTIGIPTLVVTDIDAADSSTGRGVLPQLGKGYVSSNAALSKWLEKGVDLDALAGLGNEAKVVTATQAGVVRFAYQIPIDAQKAGVGVGSVLPSTFEDALALTNLDLMGSLAGTGLLKKFATSISATTDAATLAQQLYESLKTEDKAKFALDLLWGIPEGQKLVPPAYIAEGLQWLSAEIEALPLLPGAAASSDGETSPTASSETVGDA